MKYKPYSTEWSRYRVLEEIIHEYLNDTNIPPEQISEDIEDVIQNWITEYDSRVEKGKVLQSFFKNENK